MKRIRPRTDIPDWRDPNMPVCRHYTFGNGMVKTIVDPDFETSYRMHQMIVMDRQLLSWKDDPTYFGRKRR